MQLIYRAAAAAADPAVTGPAVGDLAVTGPAAGDPAAGDPAAGEMTDAGLLARLYAYPGETAAGSSWVRANMIASADGAAELAGRSGGLGGPADRQLFQVLRALADVVLVGGGTARTEGYGPARPAQTLPGGLVAALRAGRPAVPPIAVVSGSLDLDPESPLMAGAAPDSRTIVLTTETAPAGRRAALERRAEVITAGPGRVSARAAVTALAARGHRRILTEGGPQLLGAIATAGLLDDLCLTISPVLAGGAAGRILAGTTAEPGASWAGGAAGAGGAGNAGGAGDAGGAGGAAGAGLPAGLTLVHVLAADDGFLLCRYVRAPA